jgi:hypothetical protein
MSHTDALWQWEQTVSRHLPHLSKPQAVVLALWSYAMIVSQRCGTTSGAMWLSELLGGSGDAWRQRLREWCYDAGEKHGKQRSEVVVVSCFAPLLRWIVTWWAQGEHRLALALDASTLSDRGTRAVHQRGLSRLRSSRGLVHRASGRSGSVETGLDRLVELSGWGHSCGVDGDRAG